MGKCILCNAKATVNTQDNASRTIYSCQSCGVFVVSDLVTNQVKRNGNELAAFFTSRKLAGHNEIVLITFDKAIKDKDYVQLTVDQILNQYPKSFTQITDMVLLNLSRMSSYAGEEIKVEGLEMCPVFYVRKQNYDALSFIIKSMQKFELLEVNYYGSSFFPCGVIISPKGWDRISRMEDGKAEQESALIYLPGKGNDYTETFGRVASKAARECGYQVEELGSSGMTDQVDNEMVSMIKSCRFLICGMPNATGGAYYAAAMATALGKTTILTCHQSFLKKLEINTEQIPVLTWKDEHELYLQIRNAIRALVQ